MDSNDVSNVDISTYLKKFIIDIPNFPTTGIIFKDLTPLLSSFKAYQLVINLLSNHFNNLINFDYVASIESRGFWFGPTLAFLNNKGFIPIRKLDKLPRETIMSTYSSEYGGGIIEIHKDAFPKKSSILLIDDVLATGGTMEAACNLIDRANGCISGIGVVVEITSLNGRNKLPSCEVFSILKY